jgi:hypothetical protein
MADTTVNLEIESKGHTETQEYQLDAIHVYKGTMLNVDADGYVGKAAAAANTFFAGICLEEVDNSGGSAGDLNAKIARNGRWLLTFSDTLTIADVGSVVYATDDQTATVTSAANAQIVGTITEFVTASTAWVDISKMNAATALGT